MDFRQIGYFLSLAETLNFTRAAERCHVTQPALTKSIKLLEEELGGPLVVRDGKHTHLTELGRALRERFAALEDSRVELKKMAAAIASGECSTLNIGIVNTIGPRAIARFLEDFTRNDPNAKLKLRTVAPSEVDDLLLVGEIDVCFSADMTAKNAKVDYASLFCEDMVVAFSAGHPFESLGCVSLEAICRETYVALDQCNFHERFLAFCEDRKVTPDIAMTSVHKDWIEYMIRTGNAVSIMPKYAAVDHGLCYRPISEQDFSRTIEVASVYGGPKSACLRALLRAARSFQWREQELSDDIDVPSFAGRSPIPLPHKGPVEQRLNTVQVGAAPIRHSAYKRMLTNGAIKSQQAVTV